MTYGRPLRLKLNLREVKLSLRTLTSVEVQPSPTVFYGGKVA